MKRLRGYMSVLLIGALALSGCGPGDGLTDEPDEAALGEARQAEVATGDPIGEHEEAWLPWPIDFDRTLLIRDTAVVNDPCRTRPNGGDVDTAGNPNAAVCGPGETPSIWSFGHLMREMAGNVPVHQFTTAFFQQWTTTQIVNGFTVTPRANIKSRLLDPWWAASGCAPFPASCPTLDLNRSPFRLLALVNRIDLSRAAGGPPDPYTGLPGPSSGEMRFVFGALRTGPPAPPATPAKLDAVFILEYTVPSTRQLSSWAWGWYSLSHPATTFGTSTYNNQLEAITRQVTEAGSNPGGPNLGSAIGQIRTNEVDFAVTPPLQPPWEFREHKLDCTAAPSTDECPMAIVPVARTPANSVNMTTTMDTYFLDPANQAAMMAEEHVLPPAILHGGVSRSPQLAFAGPAIWDVSDPAAVFDASIGGSGTVNPLTRRLFGLATCNGCHYFETFTDRYHVAPRDFGARAGTSAFLGVSAAADPSSLGSRPLNVVPISDPLGYTPTEDFNEPWRRRMELRRILTGDPNPLFTTSGRSH